MKRFNIFKMLRGFRHEQEVHGMCFHALTQLTEIEMETVSPLFSLSQEIKAFDLYYERHVG